MKFLLVNTLYYPNIVGGAERSVQFLAEALVQDSHEVVVISTSSNPETQVEWVNGVKVYYVGFKNLYWQFSGKENPSSLKPFWHAIDSYNPWMKQEVGQILDIEQPDLVHTNNLGGFSVLIWQAIKKRELPLVHTLRDYYLLCVRSAMFRKGNNCKKPCLYCQPYALPRRYFSSLPDAVVGVSRFILERHLKFGYFSHTQIQRVIFNANYSTTTSSCQHSSKNAVLRLGYLGRLQADKGIEFLISTLRTLPSHNWELYVAGRGTKEYEAHLQRHYTLPNIHYLGFINSKDLLSKIGFLVVPSLWNEPLGRVIFEAYNYGVPVISSNRGGIPEMIDEGKTGFIFDPDCPDTLVSILKTLAEKPEILDYMQPNCLEKTQDFAPSQIYEKYLNLYDEVAQAKR